MPYSLRIVCGFFNVPQLFYDKGCETGPPAYTGSPYPKRLESLTIILLMKLQRQHFLLSYFKTLSVGPARVELTTSAIRLV